MATVPHITLAGVEFVPVAGDHNLVARLGLAPGGAFVGNHHPAQARLEHVNAQRVFQVFATQLPDGYCRRAIERRHRQEARAEKMTRVGDRINIPEPVQFDHRGRSIRIVLQRAASHNVVRKWRTIPEQNDVDNRPKR